MISMTKRHEKTPCPNLEVTDPVCRRSSLPEISQYVDEAAALALCGVKASKPRERSQEWLKVIRGETYRQGVLINNWFDEGQDIKHLQREKRILSDRDVNYETTYKTSYGDDRTTNSVPPELRYLKHRFSHTYPRHQPELDTPYMKAVNNSWETTNVAAYVDPRLQRNPALLANVDEALETTIEETNANNSSLLKCWNCNVRPTPKVHPSLVDDDADIKAEQPVANTT